MPDKLQQFKANCSHRLFTSFGNYLCDLKCKDGDYIRVLDNMAEKLTDKKNISCFRTQVKNCPLL